MPGPPRTLRPYLLLTRVSLAPSAVVDALVGLSLGSVGRFPGFSPMLAACGASLCVFLGGMALNDWADREADKKTRPERPLPSGQITPGRALVFAVSLLLLGAALGFLADPKAGFLISGVALVAAVYDLFLRGPHMGPIALGLCRAGNLGFGIWVGISATGGTIDPAFWLPAIGYGAYVYSLSRLSPFEDGGRELTQSGPRFWLLACALVLGLLPATGFALRPQPEGLGYAAAFGVSLAAAFGLWQMRRQTANWVPPLVGKAMGLCLRRMMLATAALSCMVWHGEPFAYVVTAIALLGMKVSVALRKAYPPS